MSDIAFNIIKSIIACDESGVKFAGSTAVYDAENCSEC